MDESIFDRIYSWATFAAAIFAANLVALFKAWPFVMARLNERKRDAAAEKNGDWKRLRDEIKRLDDRVKNLDARCDHLQKEVDECREREGEWMRRALACEAASEGVGEARQQAQLIISTEREAEAKKRDKGDG